MSSTPPNSSSYWVDDQGVTANTRADAREFLRVAGEHHLEITTQTYPLSEADRALADLAAGRVTGAAVLMVEPC